MLGQDLHVDDRKALLVKPFTRSSLLTAVRALLSVAATPDGRP
jgi:hypothetical protein